MSHDVMENVALGAQLEHQDSKRPRVPGHEQGSFSGSEEEDLSKSVVKIVTPQT
jgi:hypothetical protein